MLPLAELLCQLFVLSAHLECGRLRARAHVHVHVHVGAVSGVGQEPDVVCLIVQCSVRNGRGCTTARWREERTMEVSEIVWCDDMASGVYYLELCRCWC